MPPTSQAQPSSNGSSRMIGKSSLVSKYYQAPPRPGSFSAIDAETSEGSGSPTFSNGHRAASPSFSSEENQRSATPPNMKSSSQSPSAAALPRAATFSPQHFGQRLGSQQQARNGSLPVDASKWGGNYHQGIGQRQDRDTAAQVAPPRAHSIPGEILQGPPPTNARPIPPRKVSTDGSFTLQPLAYSPAPPMIEEDQQLQQSWEQQSEASWEAGDDDPTRQTPTRPSASREGMASPQMPGIPPRLPLLYFEQDSRIDQMDFAYQKPQHDVSREASQTDLSVTAEDQQTPTAEEHPSQPKPQPRPSPPPIDTMQQSKGNTFFPRQEQEAKDESNNSFYLDSPSSNSASPKPFDEEKAGEKVEGQAGEAGAEKPPKKKTDSEIGALTSATALGFGGPSDWEHFGDYDAEEVDDLHVYSSNKPKTAELPTDITPTDTSPDNQGQETGNMLLGAHGRQLSLPRILSTIEERSSVASDEDSRASRHIDDGQGNDLDVSAVIEAHQPPPPPPAVEHPPVLEETSTDPSEQRRLPDGPPVLPPLHSEDESTTSDRPDTAMSQGSVHRDVPGSKEGSRSSRESAREEHIIQDEGRKSTSTTRSNQFSGEGGSSLSSKMSKEDIVVPSETSQTSEKTPEVVVIDRAQSPAKQLTRGSKDSLSKTSPVMSPTSDDGKEDIIISLQVPETPPPNRTTPAPLNLDQGRARSGSANLTTDAGQRSPDLQRSVRRSVFPQSIELEEPYAGLEPWAKASLSRYVRMLREEAAAGSDEDKYMTFIKFTYKETHIRAVLYDMEDEAELSDHPVTRMPSKKKQHKPSLSQNVPQVPSVPQSVQGQQQQHSQGQQIPPQFSQSQMQQSQSQPGPRRLLDKKKALPALPPPEQATPLPQIMKSPPPEDNATAPAPSVPRKRAETTTGVTPTKGKSAAQNEDSFVMVEPPRADTGLPVDRAKEIKEKAAGLGLLRGAPSLGALRKAIDLVATKKAPASVIAVQTSDPNSGRNSGADQSRTASPAGRAQIENGQRSTTPSSMDRAPYKPYSPNSEAKAYEGDKAANRQTIYRPFSTMLRQTSIRSGRSDGETIRSFTRDDDNNSTLDSAISASPHMRKTSDVPLPNKQVNYRYTILEPLFQVVPQESILREEPEGLTRLRLGMDAVPDDFSFIHKTVLAWDAEAKKARERYENDRHTRQSQSEQRIDELFNSHEIGYGDIPRLEEDFKRSEAAKKADEDREEVQTFVAAVFDVVWARINYELDQLTPLYDECTRLVADSSAGREMFEGTTPGVPIAPAMEILLILYHKLNVRHQKAFEAVLERDRRLKKTEVDPWYAAGAIEQVKRIRERYEEAEKKAILDFCRQRDERANLLMDVLDQHTLRGVGANQDYMESVMQAVRRISLDVAQGGLMREEDVVATDDVLKAKTITTALARSSEQIVQTFHVADMLLNAADYEVSVANAKLSNAEANAFRKLREAKAKEDNKLAMDLEHRMGLIRRDTARTQDEIIKLLMLIQRSEDVFEGDEGVEEVQTTLVDAEKEQQMKDALEEAMRRNAERVGGGPG